VPDHSGDADMSHRGNGAHFGHNLVDAFDPQNAAFNDIRINMADAAWVPVL
jgi:hypothetical protein